MSTLYLLAPLRPKGLAFKRANLQFVELLTRRKIGFNVQCEIAHKTAGYLGYVPESDLIKVSGKLSTADKIKVLRRIKCQKLERIPNGEIKRQILGDYLDDPIAKPRDGKPSEQPPANYKTGGQRVYENCTESETLALNKMSGYSSRPKTRAEVKDNRPRPIGQDIVIANQRIEMAELAPIIRRVVDQDKKLK